MIQIERQPATIASDAQETLEELRLRLEEAREAIYDQLAQKIDEQQVADMQKATQLIAKYQQISQTLNQIIKAQEEINTEEKNQLIKETLFETEQYKNDTAELIKKLKGRQQLYEDQIRQLISLIQLIDMKTINIKDMEGEIKQKRLLDKQVNTLRQLHQELKQQQEKETMFRKFSLTSQKDNNQYILNQIKTDSEEQLKKLKNKRETLEMKVRQSNSENEYLNKEYHQVLKEFNHQKIKTTLLSDPTSKTKSKKAKTEEKTKKREEQQPKSISAVEPILTEILVVPHSSKLQLYCGVILGFITILLILHKI